MSSRNRGTRPTAAQVLLRTSPQLYRRLGPLARTARRALRLVLSRRDAASFTSALAALRESSPEAKQVVLDGVAFQEPTGGIARMWSAVMDRWSVSGFAEGVVVIDRAGTAPRLPGFTYVEAPRVREPHDGVQSRIFDLAGDAFDCCSALSTGYTTSIRRPNVCVLYDMTPEVRGWDLGDPRWVEKREAIDRADRYVAISASTLRDLQRYYPAAAGRPAAIAHLGVDSRFSPASDDEKASLRRHLGLPEGYVVFTGHRDSYKNAELLFAAADQIPPAVGFLLLGGGPVLEPVFQRERERRTVVTARLPDESLPVAYSGAVALVYPSRYEGFGLPILEAMACDCPVITCRNSSLPEVAGDAAIYVGEDDASALAKAVVAAQDPETRRGLVARGRERVGRFSWEACAHVIEREVLAAAEEAARQ